MSLNYNFRRPEIAGAFDTLERSSRRYRKREHEGGMARTSKVDVELSQMVFDDYSFIQVQDSDVGDGITEEMVGKYWFIPDFSRTDSDDVIRP